jgi:hypothetical protein
MEPVFVGDTPTIEATVENDAGTLIPASSITVVVTDPTGATISASTPNSTTTGIYQSTVDPVTLPGIYRVDWSATVSGTVTSWYYTFVVQVEPTSAIAPAPLPVPLLCVPQDVQDRCVSVLTSAQLTRAQTLIQDASAMIRSYTRRTFAQQQITQTLRATSNILKIPQVPVISVDGVELVDYLGNFYAVPSFGFDGVDQIDLGYYSSVLNLPEDALSFGSVWSGSVKLTYTYGYNAIPIEVSSVCAQMVARIFNTPGAGLIGIGMEKVGPFEMRLGEGNGNGGTASMTGILRMSDDDKDQLRAYRSIATVLDLGQ